MARGLGAIARTPTLTHTRLVAVILAPNNHARTKPRAPGARRYGMSAKIINRACLLAVAALTLYALLLQARAAILSADAADWHAAPQSYHLHGSVPRMYSVLDTLYFADMVAHVKLKGARGEARQDWGSNYYPEIEGSTSYFPEIWFEFEAIEYMKGSGSNKIWGIVTVDASGQPTARAAREVATQHIRHIDPLHTGEAVVFMRDYSFAAPNTRQPNHYHLGWIRNWSTRSREASNSFEEYSLAGNRHWLPLASSDSDSGASEEPQFMLRHPDGNIMRRYPEERLDTVGAPDNSVITLSELRYIAKNERSLMGQTYRNATNRQVKKAAQNLTAEVTEDAIILRWNVNSSPSVMNAITGYWVFRQPIQEGDETPFYTYAEDRLGFLRLRYSSANLTKLADVSPVSASMSYEDKSGISPGTKYIYLVCVGQYGICSYVMITATNGATATGTILPRYIFPPATPTPTAPDAQSAATPTPSPTMTPTPAATQQASRRALRAARAALAAINARAPDDGRLPPPLHLTPRPAVIKILISAEVAQ